MRLPPSLAPRAFFGLAFLTLSACGDGEGRIRETFDDAGTDASLTTPDAEMPDIPGQRPVFESPGQVVPLLYGRWVEVARTRGDGARVAVVPLDDPSHVDHAALFSDLTLACRREVQRSLEPPSGAVAIPGCGREGVFDAHVALCRAGAALLFSSEASSAAIVNRGEGPELDVLGEAPREQRLWYTSSQGGYSTASWAMYAVAELRSAVAILARVFDAKACNADLSKRAHLDGAETLAEVAASALVEASQRVGTATAWADDLLRRRLIALLEEAGEFDDMERVALTRGFNDSLLERMKLYTAVPYGAFSPKDDGEPTHAARYPLVLRASADEERAALVLTSVAADALTDARRARTGDALLARFFAALREAEPLAFGSLGEGDAEAALSRFDMTLAELEGGASYLAEVARATGFPLGVEASLVGRRLRGLSYPQASAPFGYPYALTEAAATLEDDEASYASRGLAHALELASRAAQRALSRDDLGSAASTLGDLAFHEGRARVCTSADERGTRASVELVEVSDDGLANYALYRGEDAVTCAVYGVLAGVPCVHTPEAVASEGEKNARRFVIESDDELSNHLYLVKQSAEGARVVAAFSLAPLEAPSSERCAEVPLSDSLHASLGRIHAEKLASSLPRSAPPLAGSLTYELADTTPVPLTFEREVAVRRGDVVDTLRLAPAIENARVELEAEIVASCESAPFVGSSKDGALCDATSLLALHRARCLADGVARAADGERGPTGDLTLHARSEDERLSLALWAFELRQKELATLALALRDFRCDATAQPVSLPGASRELEAVLWERVADVVADLDARYVALRTGFAEAVQVDPNLEPRVRRVAETRGLHGSRLAAARLLVAVPYGAYERDTDAELFDHVFTRFPVVTEPATTAEDTRIEGLLRTSGVHPLMPDVALRDGVIARPEFEQALRRGDLTSRLRSRLMSVDPDRYASAPSSPATFLSWLGVRQYELESAVARIVQLSEARGWSLLPYVEDDFVLARGLEPASPAPKAHHLYALTEGRAALANDAFVTSRAMRGYFHALAFARDALRTRVADARDWTTAQRSVREASVEALSARFDGAGAALVYGVNDAGAHELALEVTLPSGVREDEAREYVELVWTDLGLHCALQGAFAGSACAREDFRFDDTALTVELIAGPERRVRLTGFRFPSPRSWSVALSQEGARGRVYALEKEGDRKRVIAALTLGPRATQSARFEPPPSSAWASELEAMLGYREPGVGCEGCVPRSVCETTRCELGVCLREPVVDGAPCGASTCVNGVCEEPGCGDGARSDGNDGVPFEACDDGNLLDGDGCSATCEVERRQLDPLVKEAYPAGPAPSVAVDGLGRTLIVYRRDTLALGDDYAPIQASRFDVFGVPVGAPLTIEPDAPRGSFAQPTVAGLRDGGFVVVYATADVDGLPGIAYRLVSDRGAVSEARAVDPSGSVQIEPRVAAVGDGFVVAFVERVAISARARLRMRRFDAQGIATGPSVEVTASPTAFDQRAPTLASSQGQLLVAWSESASDGANLGVWARRYAALGSAVDASPLALSGAGASEPSATVLGSGDYAVAFRLQGNGTRADIGVRVVRRFGPPLEGSSTQLAVSTNADETLPVIAGARGESYVLVYQAGGHANLFAPSIDAVSAAEAALLLSGADQRDVSVATAPQGIWMVWSERLTQSRALYALLLPFDAPPED